jgi:hypothetical protein
MTEAKFRTGTPPPAMCKAQLFQSPNDEEHFYFHKNQINLKLEKRIKK